MKIKKIFSVVFFALLLVAATSATMFAQQTPKKSSTTKKPVVKKKATKKGGGVFICDGATGYTYHSRKSCATLAKCKGRVLQMTKQEAIDNYGRKVCKNCQ